MSRRLSPGVVTLAAFAVLGAAISVYLTFVHYAGVPLVCGGGGVVDCAGLTSSAYSVVPGTAIPVTLLGIAWFAGSAGLTIGTAVFSASPRWRGAHVLWTLAGLVVVFYLVYGEVSLHKLCEWCTAVHLLVLASLLVAVARWQRGFDDSVSARSSQPSSS